MIATSCGLTVVPWWGWGLFLGCSVLGLWILYREFTSNRDVRRVVVGTVVAVAFAGAGLSAQIIYGPNCQVDFWKGVCGSWYCACMTLAGCDDCGPDVPDGAALIFLE